MTVRELIDILKHAKNPDMIVVVCDKGVPYREVYATKDGTGSTLASERGVIDGVFLLFASKP